MGRLLETVAGCAFTLSAVAVGGACLYQIKNENYEYLLPFVLVPIALYGLGQWFFSPSKKDVQISGDHGFSDHLPGLSREDFERSHRETDRTIKEIKKYSQDEN